MVGRVHEAVGGRSVGVGGHSHLDLVVGNPGPGEGDPRREEEVRTLSGAEEGRPCLRVVVGSHAADVLGVEGHSPVEAPPPVGGSWGEDDLDAHTAGDSQGVDDKEADHVAVGRTGRARNPVEEGHSPAEEAAVEVAHTPQAAVRRDPDGGAADARSPAGVVCEEADARTPPVVGGHEVLQEADILASAETFRDQVARDTAGRPAREAGAHSRQVGARSPVVPALVGRPSCGEKIFAADEIGCCCCRLVWAIGCGVPPEGLAEVAGTLHLLGVRARAPARRDSAPECGVPRRRARHPDTDLARLCVSSSFRDAL